MGFGPLVCFANPPRNSGVSTPGGASSTTAAVESDKPPLRLLLGADAIGLWEKKQAASAAELGCWRALGEVTVFEGATVAQVGTIQM